MSSSQAYVGIDIKELTGSQCIYFETKEMRKAMSLIGREVQKEAQGYVKGTQGSKAGEYPSRNSGLLMRSIKPRVSKAGFLVVVRPQRSSGFGEKEFYPSFLHYGVRAKRDKGHKKHAAATAFRIAPRKNYMADALEAKRERVRGVIFEALLRGVQVK